MVYWTRIESTSRSIRDILLVLAAVNKWMLTEHNRVCYSALIIVMGDVGVTLEEGG